MKSTIRCTGWMSLAMAIFLMTPGTELFGQELKKGSQASSDGGQNKQATRDSESKQSRRPDNTELPAAPEKGKEKPQGGDRKSRETNLRTLDQANDYWTTESGGFHMFGDSGHAVYRYPASATGTGYDTNWSFVDDFPVGSRQGWTYKEEGFSFYVFFSRSADPNGRFWTGYSFDNATFNFYAYAD